MTRSLLITPSAPADRGNGLAMRADVLREGLARVGAIDVLVTPSATASVSLETRAREADLVLVHRAYLAPLLDELLDLSDRPPVILDVDDLEPDAGLEAEYAGRVEVALGCCTADAEELLELGAKRAEVVPNAVRLPAQAHAAPTAGTGTDLLFVGNLSYAPNVEAVRWLVDEVLPLLPGISLTAAGSSPAPEVRALAGGVIGVVADPPDVGALYAAARVVVVPLLRGGGSRIKLLEAYAHGRGVVATSAGVRGTELGGSAGPAIVADEPTAFAAACRRLLENPEEAADLGARGRTLVARHGTTEVAAEALARVARSVMPATESPRGRALRHRDLELVEAEDGYVIYDTQRDRVHYLNHTAALVFELCNGTNAESRIVDLLQRAYELPEPPEQETRECINRLVSEGLVE